MNIRYSQRQISMNNNIINLSSLNNTINTLSGNRTFNLRKKSNEGKVKINLNKNRRYEQFYSSNDKIRIDRQNNSLNNKSKSLTIKNNSINKNNNNKKISNSKTKEKISNDLALSNANLV